MAGQTEFPVNFEYLDSSHVQVTVNGRADLPWEWMAPNRIKLADPVTAGTFVAIRRRTPYDHALVVFNNGSVLTQEELNKATRHVLFVVQEWADLYNNSLEQGLIDLGNGIGIVDDPEKIREQLVALVLAGDELVQRLNERIAEIDLLGEQSVANTLRDIEIRNYLEELAYLDGVPVGTVVTNSVNQLTDGLNAVVEILSFIGAKSGDNAAFIIDTDRVRVGPTESLAQRFEALIATAGANANAQIIADRQVWMSNITAIANTIEQLQVELDGANAAILEEREARISNNEVTAHTLSLMGGTNANGTVWIMNEDEILMTNGGTLGSSLSGLTTAFAQVNAAVAAESVVRANQDGALAQSINTVSAHSNGVAASVTVLQAASTQYGNRWGVSMSAGGKVTGVILNQNTSGTSTIDFLADALRISNTSGPGGTVITPFKFIGSTAYLENVVANSIVANSITAGHIVGGAVTTLDYGETGSPMSLAVSAEYTHYTRSFTTTGAKCIVDAYAEIGTTTNNPAGAVVRVYCDGSLIGTGAIYCPGSWGAVGLSIPCAHQPSAGGHTYSVTYTGTPGSFGSFQANRTFIRITELKR